MKYLQLDCYQTSDGKFTFTPVNKIVPNERTSTRDFLRENNPKFLEWSSTKLRHKAWLAGNSKRYAEWVAKNSHNVTSKIVGKVDIEYDGRLKEWMIKKAILEALNDKRNYIKVEPQSNKDKPAHKQMVYTKEFSFKKVE